MAQAQSFALSSKGLSLRRFPPRAWLCDEELGQRTQQTGDAAKEAALCSPFGFDNLPCLAVSSFHPKSFCSLQLFTKMFFFSLIFPLSSQLRPPQPSLYKLYQTLQLTTSLATTNRENKSPDYDIVSDPRFSRKQLDRDTVLCG